MNTPRRKIPLRKLPARAWEALTMVPSSLAFRSPLSVWWHYLKQQAPINGLVEFRDGMIASLSDNPHDIVTLMVNFCKQDYGPIAPNSLVVDIGGNIGMFALYACRSGAERLIAFEPSLPSYEILKKNLSQSSIKTSVSLYQLAVSGRAGETVYISNESSPYNKVISTPYNQQQAQKVATTDLDSIVNLCNGRRIDYLKIDCEGAEWDILSQCSSDCLGQVDRIRMEFHPRRDRSKSEIIDRLVGLGFKLVHSKHLLVWLDRHGL